MPRPPKAPPLRLTESPADGPVESATKAQIDALDAAQSPLGQIALTLARSLDAGAGMAAAAIAKELRATLRELTPRDGGDDFAQLMDELSAQVRDAPTT